MKKLTAWLFVGLVTGFGYAADDNSTTSSVLETPDALLEYVESTDKQFVDTGVKARGGTKVEAKLMYVNLLSEYGGHSVFLGADNFRAIAFHNGWYYFEYKGSTKNIKGYVDNNENTGFVCTYADEKGKTARNDILLYTTEVTEGGECTITLKSSVEPCLMV